MVEAHRLRQDELYLTNILYLSSMNNDARRDKRHEGRHVNHRRKKRHFAHFTEKKPKAGSI